MHVGDIILTRDKGFLPSAIRFFMKRYAKRIGVKADRYYNHAAVCVDVNGQKRIAEAMAKGVQILQSPSDYLKHHPDHLIRTWREPLSKHEKQLLSNTVKELSYKITRYEFLNFIQQMKLITRNVWKGKTGSEALGRMYCSEMVAYAMDVVRGSFAGTSYMRSPLDIQINNDLVDGK